MDPLTIGLLLGGAWLVFGRQATPAPLPAPVTPAGGPTLTPPGQESPLQYTGALPAPRSVEDVTASPIEQTGYIPPYIPTAGGSAVALDYSFRVPGTSLGGLACSSCNVSGLGDARADLRALDRQLRVLRESFRAQIRAAVAAGQAGQIRTLVDELHDRIDELVRTYQAAHPGAYPARLVKTVAPNFVR